MNELLSSIEKEEVIMIGRSEDDGMIRIEKNIFPNAEIPLDVIIDFDEDYFFNDKLLTIPNLLNPSIRNKTFKYTYQEKME